jgi:dihydrofolate reductase
MRDLIVTENITLDGVIEATEGWFAPAGDDSESDRSDVEAALREQMEAADAFLVGRTTFEQMRAYWPKQTKDTTGITDYLNRVSKYVASSTLVDPEWEQTTVLRDPVWDEIRAMKSKPGKRHRDDGQHHAGARSHRLRAGRRVPDVRVPGGAGAWPAIVHGREVPAAGAHRDAAVSLRDRAFALPDGIRLPRQPSAACRAMRHSPCRAHSRSGTAPYPPRRNR